MPQFNEKLMHFTQVLMEEASAETRAVEAEIQAARESARAKAEDQILQEAYQYIKSEVARLRKDSGRRISRQMQDNRRQLYLRREEMAQEVFDLVRVRLSSYVETPAYQDKLLSLFRESVERLGEITRLTVFLRPEDRSYAPLLDEACGTIYLTVKDGPFVLGGLVVESDERALRIDATFDTALEELNGHFAEQFGLSLAD